MSIMLRPLTLGELLDRAFQVYRSRFSLFIGIAAVAYLPLFIAQTSMMWAPRRMPGSFSTATMVGALVVAVIYLLGVAASHSATIIVVSSVYLERPITMREAYGRVSGMMVRIFFIIIGMSIGIGIGTILLIVPGIILALMWALAIPVAVLEDTGLGDSLSRSRHLTSGHRFRVFAIYLLYFVLVFGLEVSLAMPLGIVAAMKHNTALLAAGSPIVTVGGAAIGYFVECLITPILTISLSLMYYDERVRKEAFDIQLMMAALDEGPAQSAIAGAS